MYKNASTFEQTVEIPAISLKCDTLTIHTAEMKP